MQKPLNPTILFLEDDADTRALVKFTLEQAGMNVLSAQTVNEAWKTAMDAWASRSSCEIDLFLLDGLIPNGDSIKLCADLRQIEPTKPIVFYSGLAYKADILKGLEAGATAYLTKPYAGDLAAEVLQYIHNANVVRSIEANFEAKEDVFAAFDRQDETISGDSVMISEFPGSIDRAVNPASFGANRAEIPLRSKHARATRASGGII